MHQRRNTEWARNSYGARPDEWPVGEPVAVALFDDEEPGLVSIYYRYQDGGLWPCRTVDTGNLTHAQEVLSAWCHGRALEDQRTNAFHIPTWKEVAQ